MTFVANQHPRARDGTFAAAVRAAASDATGRIAAWRADVDRFASDLRAAHGKATAPGMSDVLGMVDDALCGMSGPAAERAGRRNGSVARHLHKTGEVDVADLYPDRVDRVRLAKRTFREHAEAHPDGDADDHLRRVAADAAETLADPDAAARKPRYNRHLRPGMTHEQVNARVDAELADPAERAVHELAVRHLTENPLLHPRDAERMARGVGLSMTDRPAYSPTLGRWAGAVSLRRGPSLTASGGSKPAGWNAPTDGEHWRTIDGHPVLLNGGPGHVPARVKSDNPKRFTRAEVEKALLSNHAATGETWGAEHDRELSTFPKPFTFKDRLPKEVKDHIRDNGAVAKLFTVDPKGGSGADAFDHLGDRYFHLADLAAGSPLTAAVKTAKDSNDPEVQFLAHVHANLPKRRDGGTLERLDAKGLRVGDRFTVGGVEHRVAEDADGYRVLKHGDDYSYDVSALNTIPHDKGSFRPARPKRAHAGGHKMPIPDDGIPFSRAYDLGSGRWQGVSLGLFDGGMASGGTGHLWDEKKHPREGDGTFAEKESGRGTSLVDSVKAAAKVPARQLAGDAHTEGVPTAPSNNPTHIHSGLATYGKHTLADGSTVEVKDGKATLVTKGGETHERTPEGPQPGLLVRTGRELAEDHLAGRLPASKGTDRKPEAKPAAGKATPHLDAHNEFVGRLNDGKVTAEELHAHYAKTKENADAIKAELSGMNRDHLARASMVYGPDRFKKPELVEQAHRRMVEAHHLGDSISYNPMTKGGHASALDAAVAKHTDADIASHAEKVAASRAARAERIAGVKSAVENPQTLEDFKTFARVKGEDKLTPEQAERFDHLRAEASRGKRAADDAKPATVEAVKGGPDGLAISLQETKHTKTGEPLHVATLNQRVEKDQYDDLNRKAKMLGGWYSSFKGGGAIPGFQFKSRESAEKFQSLLSGNVDRSAELQAREDGKIGSASERLRGTADAMRERAEETLNADRKTNTARRANMAGNIEARARGELVKAKALTAIADGIEKGDAGHLSGVRAATHLDELDSALGRAKWDSIKGKDLSYDERQAFDNRSPDLSDVSHARYPHPQLWASDLQRHAKALADEPGFKMLAKRLQGQAKEAGPKFKGSAGGMKTNGGQLLSADQAKAAGAYGVPDDKHVRVHTSYDWRLDRGHTGNPAYTADGGKSWGTSPEIAVNAAANKGHPLDVVDAPRDERITIDDHRDIEALSGAANRLARHPNRDLQRIGQSIKGDVESYNRLRSADIHTLPELRSALRQYVPLKGGVDRADPVKAKERALIGQKIPGFFPTPRALVDRMLDAADIHPGQKVLEPSAGKGDILDAIAERHPGVDADAVEPHSALRDILQAKGHNVAGRDVMQHAGEYDRVVMNPPFENGQDRDHVRKAYDLLKPGGKLVAIMAGGSTFSSDQAKPKEFRDWLGSVGGEVEDVGPGAFAGKDAFRQTGVNTKMVVIHKPGGTPLSRSYDPAARRWAGVSLSHGLLWHPADHPREGDGKFAEKGASGAQRHLYDPATKAWVKVAAEHVPAKAVSLVYGDSAAADKATDAVLNRFGGDVETHWKHATKTLTLSGPKAAEAHAHLKQAGLLPAASAVKPDLFGNPSIDGSGVGKQAGMFHEPDAPKPVDKPVGSRNANDPANTMPMFDEPVADRPAFSPASLDALKPVPQPGESVRDAAARVSAALKAARGKGLRGRAAWVEANKAVAAGMFGSKTAGAAKQPDHPAIEAVLAHAERMTGPGVKPSASQVENHARYRYATDPAAKAAFPTREAFAAAARAVQEKRLGLPPSKPRARREMEFARAITLARAAETVDFLAFSISGMGDGYESPALGDNRPREIEGHPVKYLWKRILTPGVIHVPAFPEPIVLSREDVAAIDKHTRDWMKTEGGRPYIPLTHADYAPLTPGKRKQGENMGWIIETKVDPVDGSLWGLHQLIGTDAHLAAARNQTSVKFSRHFRSGKSGRVYPWILEHNAIVPDPVLEGLGEFVPAEPVAA